FRRHAIFDILDWRDACSRAAWGGGGMALRLRYRIDSPRRLREHVHLVDGAGYFFFPGAVAPKGTLAALEIDFASTSQTAVLRGWVWARSTGGGLWLELAGAQRCLEKLNGTPSRSEPQLACAQHEWEDARTAIHPPTCRCIGPHRPVVLLG